MAENATPGADQAPDTTALQQELAGVKQQLTDTQQELTLVKADYHTLTERAEKLQEQVDEQAEELEQAGALIEQQTAQLKSAEVGQALGPVVVTHEKEQYRVLAPKFSHKGVDVEAAQLRTNPDLVRELVEAGSGLLVKVGAAS